MAHLVAKPSAGRQAEREQMGFENFHLSRIDVGEATLAALRKFFLA
jgi:hypothetical protein